MTPPVDGLTALASLDGAPLAARDFAALGLERATPEHGAGFAIGVRDGGRVLPVIAPDAFLGHLDDPPAIAAGLRLDPATPAIALVRAAILRHGDAAAAGLPGEWSYVGWDAATATLTLLAADTMRDALFYATDGRRIAVAPDLDRLRRLEWVDAALGLGLLLHLGRAGARGALGARTMLRGVRWTEAGTRVRIGRDGVRVGVRPPLPEPEPWRGSFGEAIEALDALLRRIHREALARHPHSAVLLSGGLDSSLIAAYAPEARIALTSAAPTGSALPDEVNFARAVAEAVRMPMRAVVPDEVTGDAYLPSRATRIGLDQPLPSPRHYVYDALYSAALAAGCDAVFDGCDGESSVTGYPDPGGWRHRAHAALTRVRGFGRDSRPGPRPDHTAFHVRLSGDALALARAELRDEIAAPAPADPVHRRGNTPWGYAAGVTKALRVTTATETPGVRQLAPFRDRRLLTLFAGMPYRFVTQGGVERAPARALLAGKIPDSVRLRRSGCPFSPDYQQRLYRHAPAARARIADQRRAGAGAWLDLDWLDGALARIAAGAAPYDLLVEAQLTACAAALIARWQSGG